MTVGQYTHSEQAVAAYPAAFGLIQGNGGDPPDWLTINQASNEDWAVDYDDLASTSGTPPPGSGGKYRLQYYADLDIGNGPSRNLNCPLVVDEAPAFTDGGSSVITSGSKLTTPLLIGGSTGYPRVVTVSAAGAVPTGMTEQIKQTAQKFGAVLKGSPKAGTQGVYPITVSGDNGLTSSEEYVLVVQAPGTTAASTTLTLSPELSDVPYQASSQTYTATVGGGSSLGGYVQFSLATSTGTLGGIATVPLVAGQATYTTPDNLDADNYTLTASYTGDAVNAPSSGTEQFSVTPAPTTLTLTGPPSTAFGVSETVTAVVTCTPACGSATPSGVVDFSQNGSDYFVDLVNGQATFITDPTTSVGSGEGAVDASFSSFSDAPGTGDFAASSAQPTFAYDVGTVNLAVQVGDGAESDGTSPVSDGDTVTVDPAQTAEFSAALSPVDSGNGTPPGPLVFDIMVGSADETATLITQSASEENPSSDPQTGQTDYYWTIPPNALAAIASSGTATVTISSAGSSEFAPSQESFTLEWPSSG
jgi:hypothetical protein